MVRGPRRTQFRATADAFFGSSRLRNKRTLTIGWRYGTPCASKARGASELCSRVEGYCHPGEPDDTSHAHDRNADRGYTRENKRNPKHIQLHSKCLFLKEKGALDKNSSCLFSGSTSTVSEWCTRTDVSLITRGTQLSFRPREFSSEKVGFLAVRFGVHYRHQ